MEFTYRVSGGESQAATRPPSPRSVRPGPVRKRGCGSGSLVLCAFINRRGLIKAHSVDKDWVPTIHRARGSL
ncbi:hypothetical protein GCM10020255_105250 [Rhodococcus baikonurensis]